MNAPRVASESAPSDSQPPLDTAERVQPEPAQKQGAEERPQQDEALLCTICHLPSCWR
jgi:hypothetical protein